MTREERNQQREFNIRLAKMQEEWMQSVRSRYYRDTDSNIKVSSHGASMAERSQKMGSDRIRLAMEIANHKVALADKWLNYSIKQEDLMQLRIARREWNSQLRGFKRQLNQAAKKRDRMVRWTDAMGELIWGSLIEPSELSRAWRGLFCVIDSLDRKDQRKIASLRPYGARSTVGLLKPKSPNQVQTEPLKGRTLWICLTECKQRQLIPIEGSELQQRLFELMELIDEALAKKGGEHQAYVEKYRAELKEMRSTHWKNQGII